MNEGDRSGKGDLSNAPGRANAASLAALALATRLVDADARYPALSAGEFWGLLNVCPDPSLLVGLAAGEVEALLGELLDAARVVALLERGSSVGLMLQRLEQSGIEVLTTFDGAYPARLCDELGSGAPPILHVVGEAALLSSELSLIAMDGDESSASKGDSRAEWGAAAEIEGSRAAESGKTLISLARSNIDRSVVNSALDAGGRAVVITAGTLDAATSDPEWRRAIIAGRLCVATPYDPFTAFTDGKALGCLKIINALALETIKIEPEPESSNPPEDTEQLTL
ncbi:MAG: hypothetical protein F2723_04565 [Actinobacteria bacterium]|uniref:Unannotated protein n=1 Tax=freshwater metagenome TaxID=449393 RepID=A0A6J6WC59_9ZZZZ|nr:hypothetical protein [Actinomycetota bacterium]